MTMRNKAFQYQEPMEVEQHENEHSKKTQGQRANKENKKLEAEVNKKLGAQPPITETFKPISRSESQSWKQKQMKMVSRTPSILNNEYCLLELQGSE